MIVSELRNAIFRELPSKWSWDRKAEAASRILAPLETHIAQVCQEQAVLDETIDRLLDKIAQLEGR